MKKKPELLCPVGGWDSLNAALLGGADAVYFGTREFNARMNAKNFDRTTVSDAVLRCHDKGCRAYVTLNTLLTDRKMEEALSLASDLYAAGVDALIVADLGLASLIHSSFPDFELHASTQMSGHNLAAAEYAKSLGFSRMVCARELDRENLRTLCAASPVEIELFVHGAICACHSGQCLMSSMIGDRSGNRGECAQPCRLPYNGSYPLSFKDLSLAKHLPEIMDLGVSSLKIEGRMKSPAYVYTAARTWRRLLDEERGATDEEMRLLAGSFSRSGFTDGYFTRRISSSMLGIRTEKDKSDTRATETSFRDSGRKAPAISVKRERKEPESYLLPSKEKQPFSLSARFLSPSQIPENHKLGEVYLPLEVFDGRKANGVILPTVIFDSERPEVRKKLEKAVSEGARHVLVGNVGHFSLAEGLKVKLHGDFRLNVVNSAALTHYASLEDVIVSPECNLAQIRDLRGKKRMIVYGRIPLMILEKRVGASSLRDRRGVVFPVVREGERDVILNSVPFYMLDREKELREKGLLARHLIFTTESRREVEEILVALREKTPPKGAIKRIR